MAPLKTSVFSPHDCSCSCIFSRFPFWRWSTNTGQLAVIRIALVCPLRRSLSHLGEGLRRRILPRSRTHGNGRGSGVGGGCQHLSSGHFASGGVKAHTCLPLFTHTPRDRRPAEGEGQGASLSVGRGPWAAFDYHFTLNNFAFRFLSCVCSVRFVVLTWRNREPLAFSTGWIPVRSCPLRSCSIGHIGHMFLDTPTLPSEFLANFFSEVKHQKMLRLHSTMPPLCRIRP